MRSDELAVRIFARGKSEEGDQEGGGDGCPICDEVVDLGSADAQKVPQ